MGRGRGEWQRPPLAPGSRPSPGSQSWVLQRRGNDHPLPTAALAGVGREPGSRSLFPSSPPPPQRAPPPRRLLPSQPPFLPSPTSGARETGSFPESRLFPTPGERTDTRLLSSGQQFLQFSGSSLPKADQVPGAELTYSHSSPGSYYFGDFLKVHIQSH